MQSYRETANIVVEGTNPCTRFWLLTKEGRERSYKFLANGFIDTTEDMAYENVQVRPGVSNMGGDGGDPPPFKG